MTSEVIRTRLAAEADPASIELLIGLVEDRLAAPTIAAIDDAVAAARTSFAPLFRQADPLQATATSSPTPTAPPVAEMYARPRTPAQKQADVLKAVLGRGNPWKIKDITAQIYVQSRDPAMAERLRHEAGVRL